MIPSKADMELLPYRLFSVGPPLSVVSRCALAGDDIGLSPRGDVKRDGRSLRDLGFGRTSM